MGDGTWYFHVRAKDNAGNWGSTDHYKINVDVTSPSGTIVVNQGAAYVTSTSVTLTLTCSDSVSGIDKVRCSNDGVWDAEPWEEPEPTKAWTLVPGDGSKSIYYQVRDKANLESNTYSCTIILDTTLPTGSIVINNGAVNTTSASVDLTLSANDTNGVAQMHFSNEGSNWSFWELFNASKRWTLESGYGTKMIYVQFKDNAGLTSEASSDQIDLVIAPIYSNIVEHPVQKDGKTFYVVTVSNSTVSGLVLDQSAIRLNIAGDSNGAGYCNVTIPKSLMNCTTLDDWSVWINGSELSRQQFLLPREDADNTYIYFTCTFASTLNVVIVPEFPSLLSLLALIAGTLIGMIVCKRKSARGYKS